MKIAGYIITPLGVLAFIGTLLGGHSPIGPLFWIAVGIVLLVLGYRKDKHRSPKEKGNRTEYKIDMETPPLLREILKQTSPDNFMEPYDAERVKCATILYQKAKDTNANQPLDVLELVERTTKDLECQYPAELTYSYLLTIFKPSANSSDFDWCNDLCQQLYNTKDSVEEMIFIVKREIEKKETQKKIELARLHQKKTIQQQLKEEEIRILAIRILKVIGIMIAIIAMSMVIYFHIDYHRINKNKSNIWTLKNAKTECFGKEKEEETKSNVQYYINLPWCFQLDRYWRKKTNLTRYNYDYYNNIDINIVNLSMTPLIDNQKNKIKQYKEDGFTVKYKINSDTLVWITYEKYSLKEGHLLGNCVFILKPSPIIDSPFPSYGNRNILLCCDGFGVTKEIADSIASSIRIKFDTLPNNTFHASHTLKKYRSVRKKDWAIYNRSTYYFDETKSEITLTIPNDFYQVKEHNRITSDDTCSSLFMTNNMDAGISIISHQKESITYFLYPTDSIIEVSSIKCKVAGCDAIKIEALGFCAGKEYKYIAYQLIKDYGYSIYQEPIYDEETYYLSDEEYYEAYNRYKNTILEPKSKKQTRTIFKGYKPGGKKIKNDDLYLCLLFGMTPQWYNDNKDVIDTLINSIKIIEK